MNQHDEVKSYGCQYLSGVAPRLRLPEEGVRQFPHPHGQRLLPGRLARVGHSAEEGLQLRQRVAAHVHDLLPGRRGAALRVHVAKVVEANLSKKSNGVKK